MSVSSRAAILQSLEGRSPDSEKALALVPLLDELIHSTTLPGRIDAWIEVNQWMRDGGGKLWREHGRWPARWERLEFYILVMENDPSLCHAHQQAIIHILDQAEAVGFFAETGMPADRGAFAEFWDSLMHRFLPQPRRDENLTHILERLFRRQETVLRFQQMPDELFARLVAVTLPLKNAERQDRVRGSFADAFRILAARVQAQFFSEAMRSRLKHQNIRETAPHRLARLSESLADSWLAGQPIENHTENWGGLIRETRGSVAHIIRSMEEEGVSVDLVHSIETVQLCLQRMESMHRVMASAESAPRMQAIHSLLSKLVASVNKERSPLHILSTRTALLHKKIVERAGETGTHYIAADRKEYRAIWWAAAGGGLLTVGTAAVKLQIHEWHGLPLFIEGLAAGLNYAVSFMLLHSFHLILATKQPAMTAARLARIIREKQGSERTHEIAGFAAQICHSQLAAALGNILLVAVGSCGFVLLWRHLFGVPFLSEESAEHVFHILSPLDSGTIFFAAWTGFLLWLASVIGGWFDNWSVYHRLPDGIRDHPLGGLLGRSRMGRWGEAVRHNMNGWATNISLGLLLGLTPSIGAFLGIPLEVRHVTLSTGQLSIAAASLGPAWLEDGWFFRALAGIGVMFVLNLSVSFLFSLFTAARAYQISNREMAVVLWEILKRAATSPGNFILPPKQSTASTPSH